MNTIKDIIKAKKATYKYFTEHEALEAVKQDGYALRYVKNQTENICLEAVKENGHALPFVKNQTENICLEAVKEDGNSLLYVKNQTENICLEAEELTMEELTERLGYEVKIIK